MSGTPVGLAIAARPISAAIRRGGDFNGIPAIIVTIFSTDRSAA